MPDPAGQADQTNAFYQKTYGRWLELYSSYTACRVDDAFSQGCSAIDEERPGALANKPCEWSRTHGLDYLAAAADNIVRVRRNNDIEVETVYDIDPLSQSFDRAIEQRYGGTEINNPTVDGYLSQYPTFKFDYIKPRPTYNWS